MTRYKQRMSSSYDRLKRYRARARVGRIVLPIELDAGAVGDLLVELGFLQAWDAGDRGKLRAALEEAIGFWSLA
jgi:hypothetical protein